MTSKGMPITWILQHGWGFDSSCWNPWAHYFSSETVKRLDRGYFAATETLNLQMESTQRATKPVTVVVHSLGLHLIPASLFQCIDFLVIIAGFSTFHDSVHTKTSDSVVEMMLQRLPTHALEVLLRFYRKCDYIGKELPATMPLYINHTHLIQDLTFLNQNRFDIQQIAHIPKILLLHGAADKIVSVEKSHELQQQLAQSKLFINKDAGHALPFTHSEWCYQIIQEEVVFPSIRSVNE